MLIQTWSYVKYITPLKIQRRILIANVQIFVSDVLYLHAWWQRLGLSLLRKGLYLDFLYMIIHVMNIRIPGSWNRIKNRVRNAL